MKIQKIIQILRNGAINYQSKLENKNFLIAYRINKNIEYAQIKFLSGNFLHLTGIQLKQNQSANQFYKKCLNGKISVKEIGIKKDGTTELKLNILEMITNIFKTAKMVGEYNNSKKNLYTEFVIGTSYISLGFVKSDNKYFIPNTALKENIKYITYKPYRIVAMFSKRISEEKYNEICYYDNTVIDNKEILQKLNLDIISNLIIF